MTSVHYSNEGDRTNNWDLNAQYAVRITASRPSSKAFIDLKDMKVGARNWTKTMQLTHHSTVTNFCYLSQVFEDFAFEIRKVPPYTTAQTNTL